jgi:hypothetical protein
MLAFKNVYFSVDRDELSAETGDERYDRLAVFPNLRWSLIVPWTTK